MTMLLKLIFVCMFILSSPLTSASEINSEPKEAIIRNDDLKDENIYFSENYEYWPQSYSTLIGTGISIFSIALLTGCQFGYIKNPTLSWSLLVYTGLILKKLIYYKILEVSNKVVFSFLESTIPEEAKEYLSDYPKLTQVTKFLAHTAFFFTLDAVAKKSMNKYVLGFFMRFIPSETSLTMNDMTYLDYVKSSWSPHARENLLTLQSLFETLN